MLDQDAIATSPYKEYDALDQLPAVRYQTDKKLLDLGVRDHSNNNADSVHENLDNTQQKIANLDKLFDQESHSLQYLTLVVERLAKIAKSKHSKGKEGTLQVVVAVAVHHLRMRSLQESEKQQTPTSIQTLSKKHCI